MRTETEHRRSTRIACNVPVRISANGSTLEGTLLDASRKGARLRVAGSPLGVYRLAPLGLVARRVAAILGEKFQVVLHADRLGSLVTKTLRPVRIGQRDPSVADVDLGCVLDPALSDLEASMLGLALPVLRADGSEDSECLSPQEVVVRPSPASLAMAGARSAPAAATGTLRAPPPARAVPATSAPPPAPAAAPAPEPARTPVPATARTAAVNMTRVSLSRWRAYVHPTGDRRLPPFLAATEAVSPQGVQLRVLDRSVLPLQGGMDVASTIVALDGAYGTDVALKLVDGPTHLWTGRARIAEVEVHAEAPEQVSLWLHFGRHLRPAELRALGLE
jgi:hypothetical protein